MKKVFLTVGIIFAVIVIVALIVSATTQEGKNSFQQGLEKGKNTAEQAKSPSLTTTKEETWHEVLFDIGEWNKNNGETTTQKFQITSDKWRIKWAKRATTMMSIEVFDSNDKSYGSLPNQPFTFDFDKTEGVLDFEGSGTYYVRFIGGTNESAGVWEIRVEELE